MKQMINRVTITGADDTISPKALLDLSAEFPFVEWGILLSKNNEGNLRFPSRKWMYELHYLWSDIFKKATEGVNPLCLSGHICGSWVRQICEGNWNEFLDDNASMQDMFSRFQLNFHSQVHKLNREKFIDGFNNPELWFRQFIFQLDNVNDEILEIAKDSDIDAVGLFDLSGGLGVLPASWPVCKGYSGYAGGLSPENLEEQLEKISKVAGDGPIWIDVETHIRSEDGMGNDIFDLDRVRSFLEISQKWIVETETEKYHYSPVVRVHQKSKDRLVPQE